MEIKTLKQAREFVVIGNGNSKMPGTTFSTDSFSCNVGERLSKIKGSVCEGCYARRIQKIRPSVDKGWKDNLSKSRDAIANNFEKWVDAAAFQINRQADKTGTYYHRWFDSGDLDSLDMLIAIVAVCYKTPKVRHWLPTREIAIVKAYEKTQGAIPANLVIRVSSPMVDDKPLNWPFTSTVHKNSAPEGHICPAPNQGNNCGDCRACWNKLGNVSYKKH